MPRPPIASPRDWRFALLAVGVVVAAGLVVWQSQEATLRSTLAPKPESAATTDELARRAAEAMEPTRTPVAAAAAESADSIAATEEPTGPVLTVRLLDPFGQPVASFAGVLLPDVGPPSKLERRAGGRMTAPVPTSAGEVVVWCRSLLPTRAPVGLGATELDIAAESGATLSGRITVEGQPWGEPLECRLKVEGGRQHLRGVPDELIRQSWNDRFPDDIAFAVAADGSFAVHGLDRDSPLTLDPPPGFSFEPLSRTPDGHLDQWERLYLEGPQTGVELDLVALPALTGRLVAATPIGDVAVTLTFHTRRRDGSSRGESSEEFLTTDDSLDGERFRIVLGYVGWQSLDIALRARDFVGNVVGFAHRTVAQRTPGVIDLGDVALEPGLTFRYRMRDDSEAAVDKALVAERTGGRSGPLSWAEGADGTVGPYAPWIDELVVTADDLEPLVVPLAGRSDGDLLDLVFTRGSVLVVRFRRPTDEPPSQLVLELAAEQPLVSEMHRRAIESDRGAFQRDEGGSSSTALWRTEFPNRPGDDLWRIHGILPGVRFRIRLLDWTRAPRCEHWLELASRERREIALTPYATARPLAIEVVDAESQPVAEAHVEVRCRPDREAYYDSATTDQHGIASFDPSALQIVWVDVRPQQGFASRQSVPISLPETGGTMRVVVERAWTFEVEPGPSQLGLDEFPWVEGHGGDDVWTASWSDEAWRFSELPALPCTVCVRHAGRVLSQAVAPPAKRIRFDLPATGQVVVRYDLPLPDAQLRGRLLRGVTLVPIDEPTSVACEVSSEATLWEPPRRGGAVEFRAVLPGRYRVVLRWDDERPSLRMDDDEEERPLEVTERDETAVELVVTAGETTEALVRE